MVQIDCLEVLLLREVLPMADNYLYAQRNQSPFQSLIQGFTGGQQIMGNISQQQMANMKNQMLQREIQKEEAVKNALAQYGQPGFNDEQAVKAIMPHHPELAIKIKDTIRKSTKDQIDMMAAGSKLMENIGPSLIDNPQGYLSAWQRMESIVPGIMPHPQNFIDPNTQQLDIPRMNEAVKRMVTGGALFLKEAELKYRDPKYHYIPAQDSEGNMIVNRIDERTGKVDQPQGIMGQKTPGMQMETQLPDGTILRMGSGGKGMSPTGVQPKTQGEIEDRLLKSTGLLSQLESMTKTFQPDFQTYGGKLQAGWTGFKSGLGIKDLSPKEIDYAGRLYAHRAKSFEMLNSIIKDLSGATVTDQEAKRLQAQLPSAGTGVFSGDNPLEFDTKLTTMKQSVQRSITRLNYLRKSGFSIKNNKELEDAINKTGITLEKMDMAVVRGKKLKSEGKSDDEIKQTLAKEFGWVF